MASPNSCVADKNSPVVTPASAPAWHRSTSTQTRFIRDRSITRPPSQTPWPATLWPPLRTATVTRSLRANLMALTTSETSAHRTIKAGCLSIIPFHTWRALLYSLSPGRRSLPRKRARNSLIVENSLSVVLFISIRSEARHSRLRSSSSSCPTQASKISGRPVVGYDDWPIANVEIDQPRPLFQEWQRQDPTGRRNRGVFVVETLAFHDADSWRRPVRYLTARFHNARSSSRCPSMPLKLPAHRNCQRFISHF